MGNKLEEIKEVVIDGSLIALSDGQGGIYHFQYFVIGDQKPIPACEGVYAFCGFEGDGIKVLFIGHTDCLARTLTVDVSWHEKWRDVCYEGAHLAIYLPTLSDRADICNALVNSYRPKCA